ncbi:MULTISPECIES: hypothetical protein [Chromobacterium]|uniref:hypothetical protein n=1 Tax=Chromobacterium TaxID=535 RepID=UPI001D08FCE9|nr:MULTISPECIES: hypothetical protein [Chromobacterium]MCP1293302.1 hypothetical protein [Chromobacterium sp. S0633]
MNHHTCNIDTTLGPLTTITCSCQSYGNSLVAKAKVSNTHDNPIIADRYNNQIRKINDF